MSKTSESGKVDTNSLQDFQTLSKLETEKVSNQSKNEQKSNPELPMRVSILTMLATVRADKKKVTEQKSKELQQKKPKQT